MCFLQQVLLSVDSKEARWTSEVVATTDSIHAVDLKELSDWFAGETPDSTFRGEAANLFFHPLPSGHFTLGRLIPRNRPLSGTKKERAFYVHSLVVPPAALLRFANNPIALFQRLGELKQWPFFHSPPSQLRSIPCPEPEHPFPLVDVPFLNELANDPGPKATAILLQSALDSVCTYFSGGPSALRMFYGLFNLLPLSWRPELTFSTAPPLARSRPFKLVAVRGGGNLFRLNSEDRGISFCDVEAIRRAEKKTVTLLDAWPLLVYHLLQRRDFDQLQRIFREEASDVPGLPHADCPPGTNPEELRLLANRCLRDFLETPLKSPSVPQTVSDCTSYVFSDLEKLEEDATLEQQFEPPAFSTSPAIPAPLATMIQQKVVKLNDSESSPLLRRIKKFPYLKDELRRLDSCTARVLLGDASAQAPFRTCWDTIRSRTDRVQQLELTEDYLLLIRDFMNSHTLRNEPRFLERDINILELLDALLE